MMDACVWSRLSVANFALVAVCVKPWSRGISHGVSWWCAATGTGTAFLGCSLFVRCTTCNLAIGQHTGAFVPRRHVILPQPGSVYVLRLAIPSRCGTRDVPLAAG